ncbi:unnamed protein product [Coregonus sp. 'balchen']|nr:unnamed protein product [Coregonus sp. 'balchen']
MCQREPQPPDLCQKGTDLLEVVVSFFGKLKNLHSGPPAPPKRIENNAGYGGWPEDEFDEEDGDTYEAPPCERPAMKVPPRHVEENVYLDRTSERSNRVLPKRQAAPPPRPVKMAPMGKASVNYQSIHAHTYLSLACLPVSVNSSLTISLTLMNVYLDPNEGQGDSDDLYLEPTAACPPAPRGPIRMPLPPKTAVAPPPMPIKPPVPRAKSLPPPTPGIKPPLPASLKEPKPRKTAEDLLLQINKDGAFLIRCSSAQNARQPYTLAVLYRQKVYNIPIRFLEETRGYALGKEGKKNEEVKRGRVLNKGKNNESFFCSLQEIISHHKNNQLLLIDSKSQAKHTTYLTHPARP